MLLDAEQMQKLHTYATYAHETQICSGNKAFHQYMFAYKNMNKKNINLNIMLQIILLYHFIYILF